MPSDLNYDSQHWQLRADEFRKLADSITGPDARDTMLRIAEHYDRLATKSDERTIGGGYPAESPEKLPPPQIGGG